MQLIEQGRLKPDQDVADALGEKAPRGLTVAQLLTQRSGDPGLLTRVVEKASGAAASDYVAKNVAQPLGMARTRLTAGDTETTLADLGHLGIALVNGGALGTGRILMPASVADLEQTHSTLHPALPGWAYGFAEMRRNGWRALQAEGAAGDFTLRLVIVPEAKLAYVLQVKGRPDARLWRTLDNGLFDKIMPPHASGETNTTPGPAPTPAETRAVAGTYEPARDPTLSFVSFKSGRRLFAGAGSDGSLLLTGAENASLSPRPGGYWGTTDGNLNAIARDGRLILSTGAYRPLALYKRPLVYASLALLLAIGVPGAFYYQRRRSVPSALVLGMASASVLLVAVSILVWLFSPSA
jgi:CubicO group peptidase (beta-lactamase class C family)